jgi:biopolymer transport protein ExbD
MEDTMAAQTLSRSKKFAGINVTPLVDITLVLLIVFMVTAKLVVSQSVPVDLPKASTGSEQQTVLAITIAKDGAAVVDSQPVASDAKLAELAAAARARSAEARAVIQADSAVAHGRVVRVMDVLRRSGLTRIGFGITPSVQGELAAAAEGR